MRSMCLIVFLCGILMVGTLYGQGVQADVEFWSYPVQGMGEKKTSVEMARSVNYPFRLKNVSGARLRIRGFSFTGTDAADFEITDGSRVLSNYGDITDDDFTERLYLRYKARASATLPLKARSATLVVTPAGDGATVLNIPFTAENGALFRITNVSVSPSVVLSFPLTEAIAIEAPVGGRASVSLRVENIGSSGAVFTDPVPAFAGAAASKFSAAFASEPLAPGATRDLVITYQPGDTDVASGSPDTATLAALASNTGTTFTDGTGAARLVYDLSFSGTSREASYVEAWTTNVPESTDEQVHSFPLGSQPSYIFYLKNVHTSPVSITEFSFTGRSVGQFVIALTPTVTETSEGEVQGSLSAYATEIAPDAYSPAFYVLYHPVSASAGPKSAKLSIQPSAGPVAIVDISARKAPVLQLKVQEGTVAQPRGDATLYGESDFPLRLPFATEVDIPKTITLTVSNEGSHDLRFNTFVFSSISGDKSAKYKSPRNWSETNRLSSSALSPGQHLSYEITYEPGDEVVGADDPDEVRTVLLATNLSVGRVFRINLVGTAKPTTPTDLYVYVPDASAPDGEREVLATDEGSRDNPFTIEGTTVATNKDFAFKFRNKGGGVLQITSIAIQEVSSSQVDEVNLFRVLNVPTSEPLALSEAQETEVKVTFTGSGTEAGEKKVLLSISSNSQGGEDGGNERSYKILLVTAPRDHTHKVYLGTQVIEEEEVSYEETIDFISEGLNLTGDKRPSHAFTVENKSTEPLQITDISINEEAATYYSAVPASALPITLAREKTTTFSVYYAPASLEGQELGELRVVTDGVPPEYLVRLRGRISFSELAVERGEEEVPSGNSAAPLALNAFREYPTVHELTLRNIGNQPLVISALPTIGDNEGKAPLTFLSTFSFDSPLEILSGKTALLRFEATLTAASSETEQDFSVTMRSNSNAGDYKFWIRLTPPRSGAAAYKVLKGVGGEPVPLNGTVQFPEATALNPGARRGTQTLSVQVIGTVARQITDITFTGGGGAFSVAEDFSGGSSLSVTQGSPRDIVVYYAPTLGSQRETTMTLTFDADASPRRFVVFLKGNPKVAELEFRVDGEPYAHESVIEGTYLLGDEPTFSLDLKNIGEKVLRVSSIAVLGPEGVGNSRGLFLSASGTTIPSRAAPWAVDSGDEPRKLELRFNTKTIGLLLGGEEEDINKGRIKITSNHNFDTDADTGDYFIDTAFKILDTPNLAVYHLEDGVEEKKAKRFPYEAKTITFKVREDATRTLQIQLRNLGNTTMLVKAIGFGRNFVRPFNGFEIAEAGSGNEPPDLKKPRTHWRVTARAKAGSNEQAIPDSQKRTLNITYSPQEADTGYKAEVLRIETDAGGNQFPARNRFELHLVPDVQDPTLVIRQAGSSTRIEDGATYVLTNLSPAQFSFDVVNSGGVPIELKIGYNPDPHHSAFSFSGAARTLTLLSQNRRTLTAAFDSSKAEPGEYKVTLNIQSDAGSYSLNFVAEKKDMVNIGPIFASPPLWQQASSMHLLPNPSYGISYLRSDEFPNGTYTVHDMGGRLVRKGRLVSGKAVLDLSAEPRGVYVVQLAQEVKKLIVD